MSTPLPNDCPAIDPRELEEWREAFEQFVQQVGHRAGARLLEALTGLARRLGVDLPVHTPYLNTIAVEEEVPYPGNRDIEARLEGLVRWNAMAMVFRQNEEDKNIGGHLSTFASLATLQEVGFNHYFHANYDGEPGDFVYFQGHASPGVYARALLEGRITQEQVENFRHELRATPGLPSYPHPRLMRNFWQFPTVSMGIGPINAIYQAHVMRYLENRDIIKRTPQRKVWAFIGDGETDEPEVLGSGLTLAAREKLDNLIFVVNCNLQRLDGPVRGNGKIITELEGVFRGAGWNVIKVIWGSDWDPLLARDTSGMLLKRMEECPDGDYQTFKAKDGAYFRENFFGKYPETSQLVLGMSDDAIFRLQYGGHDPQKVYNAYKRAVEHTGAPTVILAKTIKGYGLPSQALNGTHQDHGELLRTEEARLEFRSRFDIPIPEKVAKEASLYRPAGNSPEIDYLKERRRVLGGYIPARNVELPKFTAPALKVVFANSLEGSKGLTNVSTTKGFVNMLRDLVKDDAIRRRIALIIPDEARTFGMQDLIAKEGIYASQGQLYTPPDAGRPTVYNERKNGLILEEGITEAGCMASFTAVGTAYSSYRVPMIPFFTFYSMFGFQRVGDQIWAFGDALGKGFLMGGTAGRTTLGGEGLQHQDGHSPLLSSVHPTCAIYDPAYVYELAVIVQDGIRRMYEKGEDCFYYITVYNENYAMPKMPKGVEEGIIRGIYICKPAEGGKAVVQLVGSGPILNEALRAQSLLAERYGLQADVWSVTSYTELCREALEIEKWNAEHPAEAAKQPFITTALASTDGPIIAASDYMKTLPYHLAPWLGERLLALGTDGFGCSDNRQHLRRHFGIDAESIAAAALSRLAREGKFDVQRAQKARQELGLTTRGKAAGA